MAILTNMRYIALLSIIIRKPKFQQTMLINAISATKNTNLNEIASTGFQNKIWKCITIAIICPGVCVLFSACFCSGWKHLAQLLTAICVEHCKLSTVNTLIYGNPWICFDISSYLLTFDLIDWGIWFFCHWSILWLPRS